MSPGCTNCYAMRLAHRFGAQPGGKFAGLTRAINGNPVWNGVVRLDEKALNVPLGWRKPKRIFVNSMSDLFHESLPDEAIDRVFAVMALCQQHQFLCLTKRAERMQNYVGGALTTQRIAYEVMKLDRYEPLESLRWPLPNVWLGVSVEDQARANERIPPLMETPAAVRFISAEPLLGPVNLTSWLYGLYGKPRLDWVIVGGESGAGARPMNLAWARSIVAPCSGEGVSVFVKQLGAVPFSMTKAPPFTLRALDDGPAAFDSGPFYAALKDRKGGDISEFPVDLQLRDFPA